jgi:hypothetical protein
MPRNRNKFGKKNKKKTTAILKSDNTDYSIEIDEEVIYVPQEIENKVNKKKSKFLFFEKSKDKKADSLIKNLQELTEDIQKKALEQKNLIIEDSEDLEQKAREDALKKSNEVKDLILEKIKENALELKDLILFRKKIDVKNNLKEDMEHIKETIIEKIKDYIEDMSEEIIEKINENVMEIKEIIFGKELKQEEKSKKSNTFDSLIQNLKSFSTKFEKKEEKVVEEQKVVMKEIIEKEKIVKSKLLNNDNLKIIEVDEELIMTFPLVSNRCVEGLNLIFTNIDNSDEIIVKLKVVSRFGSIKSRFTIVHSKQNLMLETKWTNTLKIRISNGTLYLGNSLSTINCKILNKKIDVIKTNIKKIQWL